MIKSLTIAVSILLALAADAMARDEISGPVSAEIIRVIDGDTLLVEAQPWPQQKMEVYVRIRGIDTPELKSKCQTIRAAASDARQMMEQLAGQSTHIQLIRISGDKYFGRIVADVIFADGQSAADNLLLAGLARPYDGGRKPKEACGD
ncbi:thermonuclease family protein [Neorhizobium sp. NCHU2750]|uniref:thermonuclease family protein n=1 Tax=Neorhizobium sp. NCHU2750 TaxID=1825976 RepID=UPI000E71528E|nr:nuclease [Neorhizobium sp. NCHU2750]